MPFKNITRNTPFKDTAKNIPPSKNTIRNIPFLKNTIRNISAFINPAKKNFFFKKRKLRGDIKAENKFKNNILLNLN